MKLESSIVLIYGIYRMYVPEACRRLVIVYLRTDERCDNVLVVVIGFKQSALIRHLLLVTYI